MKKSVILKFVLYGLLCFSICLIVVNLIRSSFGGRDVSFLGFLDNLSNTDSSIALHFDISSFKITDDWSLLNPLRNFINGFGSLIAVLIWLGVNVINVVLFLGQFVAYVFTA